MNDFIDGLWRLNAIMHVEHCTHHPYCKHTIAIVVVLKHWICHLQWNMSYSYWCYYSHVLLNDGVTV